MDIGAWRVTVYRVTKSWTWLSNWAQLILNQVELTWLCYSLFSCCRTEICCEPVKVTQSCPTLCDPMDYILRGSPVHGILQARIPKWVAILFSRGSSQPRESNPDLLHCRWILYHLSHQGRQKWELVNGKGASIQNRVSYLPTSDFHSYSAYLLLEAPYWRLEHF